MLYRKTYIERRAPFPAGMISASPQELKAVRRTLADKQIERKQDSCGTNPVVSFFAGQIVPCDLLSLALSWLDGQHGGTFEKQAHA
jgi:hypothetical protein